MMHMTFYWGKDVTFLFTLWKADSWGFYFQLLFLCFLYSVLYQRIEGKLHKFKVSSSAKSSQLPSISTTLLPKAVPTRRWVRLKSTLLFGLNSAIGYLLMLAVMTFNGGIFIAIVSGLSVGYFFYKSEDDAGDDAAMVVEDNRCTCF